MRESGNDNPKVCVMNLLRTKMDRPTTIAISEYVEDAKRVISDYEPRVDVESIGLRAANALNGNFAFLSDIRLKGEEEYDDDE